MPPSYDNCTLARWHVFTNYKQFYICVFQVTPVFHQGVQLETFPRIHVQRECQSGKLLAPPSECVLQVSPSFGFLVSLRYRDDAASFRHVEFGVMVENANEADDAVSV